MSKSHFNIGSRRQTGFSSRSMPPRAGYLGFLLFLFSFYFSSAQDEPSVKASVDKTQIVVGDPFRLTIDIATVRLPQLDSIPHFEWLGKGTKDSLTAGTGSRYHLEWKLTSFDSGVHLIPSFPVQIGGQNYQTDSLSVQVTYGAMDSLKNYHDIRGIIDKENPAVKYIPWVVLGFTLLSILLFAWSVNRMARASLAEPGQEPSQKNNLSALDEALSALDALKTMTLTDAASVKKYYSAMNDVLRVFLVRNMRFSAMVRTNEELIMQLSRVAMDRQSFSHLAGVLRMSDFVKFAKYIPGQIDNEKNLEIIRSSITIINEIR
jgi:hypothetical protein